MAPVFSCFVRSLELKCEACSSKARYLQAQPATPRAMWPPRRPRAEDVLCKGLLVRGEVERYCHWHRAVDEKQLISWARTKSAPQKWRPTCQFRSWSSKSQEAKLMHDLLQPTEIVVRRSSGVARLYVRLDRGSKAWVNSQDLLPFAWFFSSTSLSQLRSTTQLATHGAAPKTIGREVEKKCPVGVSKHGRSG